MVGLVTAVMIYFRTALHEAHIALAYLLIIQLSSARHGRRLGFPLAVVAFLLFDWFFVVPYGTLVVAKEGDLAILVGFLITSLISAELFDKLIAESSEARLSASELDRLSLLGAETINAPRAENALEAIVSVIHSALGVKRCAIYGRLDDEALRVLCVVPEAAGHRERDGYIQQLKRVMSSGSRLVIRNSGVVDVSGDHQRLAAMLLPEDADEILLPLVVRGQARGVLVIEGADGLKLSASQLRFLDVLSYYAALAAERVELVAASDRADLLRESSKLKDAVLASVSHDLRTPLTTIKALAHDIRLEGDERAAVIEEEADQLNVMVANLLDLSRLNSGSLSVSPELNEAEDLIGAVLQRIGQSAGHREITVSVGPGEPLLLGTFDFQNTLRVMVNLVENALKYSTPPDPVIIGARREGLWLALSVSDSGPRIEDSEITQIFEPFYRSKGAPPGSKGAGLGLSIARGLAEAQGGTLHHQHNESGGNTFIVRVPAADLMSVAQS